MSDSCLRKGKIGLHALTDLAWIACDDETTLVFNGPSDLRRLEDCNDFLTQSSGDFSRGFRRDYDCGPYLQPKPRHAGFRQGGHIR